MSQYKVEYIYTSPEGKKWYNPGNIVDGWSLKNEFQALLNEYEKQGYALKSFEGINSPNKMSQPRTDGLIVVFEKIEQTTS